MKHWRSEHTLARFQEVTINRRSLKYGRAAALVTTYLSGAAVLFSAATMTATPATAQQQQRPNIVVIMGDDIGIWNIGAYHRGMMAGRTPNLDKIAAEGMLFTDYYAEASCTAGRANFITGELPIRTGMTTVGQAGAPIGLPAEALTIATALKGMGYATGQFGKNHLGDLNEFLPTVHGFDEFFGYLYHLDAMEDPAHPELPAGTAERRSARATWSTRGRPTTDDADRRCRAGARSASRRSRTPARSIPKRMETVDDEIRDLALKFIDKAKADNKPFFLWLNPTRMHIVTHLSPKYEAMRNSKNGWSHPGSRHGAARRRRRHRDEEAQGHGRRRQHHRRLHHRQRHRGLHLAGRRADAVRAEQGHGHGRRLPRAGDDPLAGQGAGRQGRERHHLRARLVPDARSPPPATRTSPTN